MRLSVLVAVLPWSWVLSVPAQGPTLVYDINQQPAPVSSDLHPAAADPHTARNADRDHFVQALGLTFFAAQHETHGRELCVSDGTPAGTVVLDLVPGADSSLPQHLFAFGGIVYFTAIDSSQQPVLWRSNGTAAGTWVVHAGIGSPSLYTPLDATRFLFRAVHGVGFAVYVTDGTAAGTALVSTNLDPRDMAPLPAGGVVVSNQNDRQLYRVSPTLGVTLLSGASGPVEANDFQVAGSHVFFTATHSPDTTGPELWRTDGTVGGTLFLADVLPGPIGGTNLLVACAHGGELYFRGNTLACCGGNHQLWRSNGTVGGTYQVTTTLPFLWILETSPAGLCLGTSVYLYVSDGTAAGTLPIPNAIGGTIVAMRWLGGRLWWRSAHPGYFDELNVSDLTPAGTGFVDFLRNTDAFAALPGGDILLRADDGLHGSELWRSDGTNAGTTLVADLRGATWTQPSTPSEFCELDAGRTCFAADDGNHGRELWISNGTAAGTVLVADLAPGAADGSPHDLERLGGRILFAATDSHGTELHATDGSAAGTGIVLDISPTNSSNPTGLTRIGGRVYFAATDDNFDTELWASDGSSAGTVQVADLDPAGSSNPGDFCEVGYSGVFVFAATVGGDRELWRSDGTAAGTFLLLDIQPGGSGNPQEMTRCGDHVVFRADDGVLGAELWITDGTPAGTLLLKDLMLGAPAGSPRSFASNDDGRCVFTCDDWFTAGQELWVTDGTPAGTQLAVDLVPGAGSLQPSRITWCGNRDVYLRGTDPMVGDELWRIRGLSAAGTNLVPELQPGPASSAPDGRSHGREQFQDSFGRLYLAADDGELGSELHVVLPGAWSKAIDRPCGTGAIRPHLTATPPILGTTCTLTSTHAPVPSFAALALHLGPAAPADLGGGCRNHLFGGAVPIFGWVGTPGATWSLPVPVPAAPALAGLQVAAQGLYSLAFTAFDGWTNGVWLQIGF